MGQLRNLFCSRALRGWLVAIVSLGSLASSVPVEAAGGIAMSGSFYQQSFEIPQGSSIGGPDIYVVIFNNSGSEIKVKMTSQAPPGVTIALSITDFTLPDASQMQVQVTVRVDTTAVPGSYDLGIVAEPYREASGGIQLLGAASQRASLAVLGESGMVSVQAMSPDGFPIVSTVRLYRVVAGQNHEVAYSDKGSLSIKVAPGTFVAISFLGGIQVAEEKFDIAAGETKNITLSGATVYFEGFDVVPNYQKGSGALAFLQVVYTVTNIYQRVDKGEVILKVSKDGAPPTETLLATLSPLETGRAGLNYNYLPSGSWAAGDYTFQLLLNIDGKAYTTSPVKNFTASGGKSFVDAWLKNPYVIGAAVAVVLLAGAIFFFSRRRKSEWRY
jgi:hypothetical protein